MANAHDLSAGQFARGLTQLQQQLDTTIAHLREITSSELEAGLNRELVVEHRKGSMRSSGGQFLLAFAIPHFFYHLASAYGILHNQGIELTMGDFLGNWATA